MRRRLRVKEVAQNQGFSMGKLSRNADVAYRTVQLICNDPYRDVELGTLEKLAKVLGVMPFDLVEYFDDEEDTTP
ncbi:MAG TPA: helix-turn-helix transcriptional regulator [Dictyobacter sp.]|jgi:DNA-binding Xre family transcriptional regulator|nr:helix-turn-helix transcriptional regulator [Dictyobacter sp.]